MTVSDAGRVRTSLKSVLDTAGLVLLDEDDGYHIDLTGLDEQAIFGKRQFALQTTASLLFRVGVDVPIVARLPLEARSRRALAASGLMFALVQHDAKFDDPKRVEEQSDDALFSSSELRRLTSFDAWRHTFTPFNTKLRDLLLGSSSLRSDAERRAASSAGRGLGVYDSDFTAFVNPHELRLGTELAAISELAAPWFTRLMSEGRAHAADDVHRALLLLGHALDNIQEHAFDDPEDARSLVTVGRVDVGDNKMCRLQVMDNGVGIPTTLARQLDREIGDRKAAEELLSIAVHGSQDGYDPLLLWGRGQGLPEMRRLTGELGGSLNISTSGPGDSLVSISCEGDQASEPISDLIPVTGTIVTLWVPLSSELQAGSESWVQEAIEL